MKKFTAKCQNKQVHPSYNVCYIPKGQKLCDFCLLRKFNLNEQYDSEDREGLVSFLFTEDVIFVLRELSKL